MKGQIVTTKDSKQWRVLSRSGDTLRVIEYRENDDEYFPEIKTINLKDIEATTKTRRRPRS